MLRSGLTGTERRAELTVFQCDPPPCAFTRSFRRGNFQPSAPSVTLCGSRRLRMLVAAFANQRRKLAGSPVVSAVGGRTDDRVGPPTTRCLHRAEGNSIRLVRRAAKEVERRPGSASAGRHG
jgi:hypothetical protein